VRGPHPHPTITLLLTIQHIQVIGTAELEVHISYPTMYCSFTISPHDHCNHSPLANLFLHQQTHPRLCHTQPRADAALPTLVYCYAASILPRPTRLLPSYSTVPNPRVYHITILRTWIQFMVTGPSTCNKTRHPVSQNGSADPKPKDSDEQSLLTCIHPSLCSKVSLRT